MATSETSRPTKAEIIAAIESLTDATEACEVQVRALGRFAKLRGEEEPDAGGVDASPNDAWYISEARRRYARDGECEIDNTAVVSRGDDPGAYVMAWLWVYDPDREEDEDAEV